MTLINHNYRLIINSFSFVDYTFHDLHTREYEKRELLTSSQENLFILAFQHVD